MKKFISLVIVLSAAIMGCTKNDGSGNNENSASAALGNCPQKHTKPDYNFGSQIDIKSGGQIQLCGFKDDKDKYWGDILFKPKSGKGLKRVVTVGGPTDLTGPLSTNYVKIVASSQGLEVIKMLPFGKGFIKGLAYAIKCTSTSCVKDLKAVCKFRRPQGKVVGSVIGTFTKFVRRQGPFPSRDDIYTLFDNSLLGDKTSIALLLSSTVKDRFEAQGSNAKGQGAIFNELQRQYQKIVDSNCRG